MPLILDGSYQISDHGLTVTARSVGSEGRQAEVCLAGDIDAAASDILATTLTWLTRLAPVSVLVDLADVTFACSTLPNFIARVRSALPTGAELVLWRPRPAINRILRITDMPAIALICSDSSYFFIGDGDPVHSDEYAVRAMGLTFVPTGRGSQMDIEPRGRPTGRTRRREHR